MYRVILVPHAGTDGGDVALKHAVHIAKMSSAKIILLHIVEEMPLPVTFAMAESERKNLYSAIRKASSAIKQDMHNELLKRVKECKEKGIEVKAETKIGYAAQIIVDYIKNNNIDLVVMAKRRKLKGVKKLLSLGSVSRKVVENVTIPVLLLDAEKM